ncbi:MAG: hypothetical protein KatS3mg115_1442 [Candidatus Poribacteria bacterium]|nr:MAG: hypothetical protein KatS3mg115_1442 [Candidatus Poribacteria bacterium]
MGASEDLRAAIFLNGEYEPEHLAFYRRAAERPNVLIICADGALEWWNEWLGDLTPHWAVGDFDSLSPATRRRWEERGTRFDSVVEPQRAKEDYTDGELALYAAAREGCLRAELYGAFPRRGEFQRDHFLGNLYLLAEAITLNPPLEAILCAPRERVYCCREEIVLRREGTEINRVSLLPLFGAGRIVLSEGLRWSLNGLRLDPFRPNALRNEFLPGADRVLLRLEEGSPPVLVVHNW